LCSYGLRRLKSRQFAAVGKNADYRQREYLTEGEIDRLLATAGNSRNPVRDRLLILMAFRHALRVSELVDIRWQQIVDTATVHIRRAKNGTGQRRYARGDDRGARPPWQPSRRARHHHLSACEFPGACRAD
jgi:integrase